MFNRFIDQVKNFKFDKVWMYLIYLDFILPLCMFVLAYSLNSFGTGYSIARLFHTYNLFFVSPIPNFESYTGVVGLAVHVGFIAYALFRKGLKDALICTGVSIVTFLYIYFEINYSLSYLLKFA